MLYVWYSALCRRQCWRRMRSPQRSTELPCPRRAEESDKKTSICAISASSSSFLIKGNSREDSLTVTLPGTTDGYKFAYAISMGNCEIRNCSVDIMVIGGMQNAGDNIAIRVSRKTTDFRPLKTKKQSKSAADSYIIAGRRHFLGFMDYIFCTDRSTRPPISRRSCILVRPAWAITWR